MTFLLSMISGEQTPDELPDANLLDVKIGASSAAVVSNSVAPANDALLIAVSIFRDSADEDHQAPTTTLANVGTWTKAGEVSREQTSVSRWFSAAFWWAKITGDPGEGTVTYNLAGSAFNFHGLLFEIASDYHPTTPIRQFGSNSVELSAGSLAVDMASDPLSLSQVISVIMGQATTNAMGQPSTWADLVDKTVNGSTDSFALAFKNGSVSDPHTWTGLDTDETYVAASIEVQLP